MALIIFVVAIGVLVGFGRYTDFSSVGSNVSHVSASPSLEKRALFYLKRNVGFYSCVDSMYYSGHGVETLDTDDLNDYLAALNLSSSSLCFDIADPAVLGSLKLVWYSESEAPSSIEVVGVDSHGAVGQVLWSKDRPLPIESLNGYFYTDIKLDSNLRFSRFRIRYVGGANQDRLLLRAVTPFFIVNVPPLVADLLSHVYLVSRVRPYGRGISYTSAADPISFVRELERSDSLHCGNYAFIFVNQVSNEHPWTLFNIRSKQHAIHDVVELNYFGFVYTVDPTLGIVYGCAYADMLNDRCDYFNTLYTEAYNPVMWRYTARHFFPDSSVVGIFTDIDSLLKRYRRTPSYLGG